MSIINFPIMYINDPEKGRPIFNGQMYFGQPDLDPEIFTNQKQVYYIQEDGDLVAASQPILLSAGGNPTYNGDAVTLSITGEYSTKVLNKLGIQEYYIARTDSSGDSGSVIAYAEDPQTLIAGQLVVDFTGITVAVANIYVGKNSGDRGKLFEGDDYIVTGGSQITLTNSFSAGTKLIAASSELTVRDDASQAYEFPTVAAYKTSTLTFPVGKVINLLDRGASFTVVDGTGTANGFNVIASDEVSQSIDLVVTRELMSSQWGSVESTTADSSLVIQAISDYVTPDSGQTIYIEGDVLFETKPKIPAGVSVICTGVITSDAPSNDVSLAIGDKDVFTAFINIKYDISMVRKTESNFSNPDNIGVIFENIIGSDITLRALRGFSTGAVGRGNTSTSATDQGFAWNTIKLGDLDNNLVGFDFRKFEGGGGVAFANQNEVHHYGRIQQRNAVATASSTLAPFVDGGVINAYAIKAEGVNGNQFYNQSLELSWTRSSDGQVFNGTGFLFNDCVNNSSYNSRFESAFAVAKLTGGSRDNYFSTLYSDPSNQANIIDESDQRSNELLIQNQIFLQPKGASWDSGPLAEMTQQYSPGKICTVGASWAYTSGSNDPTIEAFDSTIQALPDGILLGSGRGVSWRLDTQQGKKFVIRRMNKDGEVNRILISARKPDGTQWTGSDTDAPYVRSSIGLLYTGATFAGWKEPVDSDKDLFFTVNDDVDHVIIQISQGILQRVQIQSLDRGTPVVTSGFKGFNTKQRMTKISPIDGWWTQGEEAINFDAATSQPIHWKAEQNGWACNSIWSATTAYSVNDIRYNGANVYICRIAGTSASSGGPTGAAQGIADSSVTWDYVGSRVTFRAGPLMP